MAKAGQAAMAREDRNRFLGLARRLAMLVLALAGPGLTAVAAVPAGRDAFMLAARDAHGATSPPWPRPATVHWPSRIRSRRG
jgi:hypothetical protein